MKQHIAEELLTEARVPKRFWGGIDPSDFFGTKSSLATVTRYAKECVHSRVPDLSILFQGGSSSGKTYLMCGLVTTLLKHNFTAQYWSASDLAQGVMSKELFLTDLTSVQFLAIDDLSPASNARFDQIRAEMVLHVLKSRFNNKLNTFVATTVSHSDSSVFTDQFGESMFQFFSSNAVVVACKCDSLALRKRREGEKQKFVVES